MNFKLKHIHWKNQEVKIKKYLSSPYDCTNKLMKFCGDYALDPIILRKYIHDLPWKQITINQELSEDIMREFEDYIYWPEVPRSQICSESFIKEYKKKMMCLKFWHFVSKFQTLSEKFIEEYANELDWDYISSNQDFSDAFAERFIDKINWSRYFTHHNCCDWRTVGEGFIKRHLNDKFRNVEILKDIVWAFPVSRTFENKLRELEKELITKGENK